MGTKENEIAKAGSRVHGSATKKNETCCCSEIFFS
jgi:hypothetical protein